MILKDKTLAITGANGALGQAVAEQALHHGASTLVLIDVVDAINTDKLKAISPNATLLSHNLDLTDKAATQALFAQYPSIDALCNIAGGFDMGSTVYEMQSSSWDAMFAINVTTMQNAIAACTPNMIAQNHGNIVNVGALGALQGQAQMSAYIASKSVVMRLTESLAEEVKAHNVNVNAVLPNVIDTARNRSDMPDADYRQWVAPEDLANVICALASPIAKAMHGALVPVRGLG